MVCVFGACVNASPPSTPQGADSGAPLGDDAGTDATVSGPDASPDAGIDGDAGDATDATPVDAQVGPFTVISTIPLAGSPSAMAFNPVTNTLYVALTDTGGPVPTTGVGIAVIDGATNTLAATIPYPGDAAAAYPIVQMAIDFSSNTLYAADSNPGAQTLYVINGATNTVTTTLPIASDLGMQVDSVAHRIYVLGSGTQSVPDGGTAAVYPPTITVIDDAANDAGTPIVFDDQALSAGSAIAFDPILHHLYLCGANAALYSNGTHDVAAVDTLDTTNDLAPVGAQQSAPGGGAIACLGGWGGGAVVTANSASVDLLDTKPLALPSAFIPTAAAGGGAIAPEKANVVVFGASSSPGTLAIVGTTENADGGVRISLPATPALPGAGATAWGSVVVAAASGGVLQAYLTYVTTSDAGAATPSVTYASILAQ